MIEDNTFELFEKDGIIIKLNKYSSESREHFLIRSYFILNNIERINKTNQDEFNNLVNLSFLFLNKNYMGNDYSKSVLEKLNNFNCNKV